MLTTRRLVIAGAIALLLFAVVRFPASTAFAWFAPASVGGFGISGTLWRGEAALISAPGLQLRETQWNLSAWQLLLGRLGGDLRTRWGGGFIEAGGSVSVGGNIALRDIRGSFAIGQLSTLLGTPDVGGIANLDIKALELSDNWPTRIVGSGDFVSLTSALMGSGANQLIGDIGFEFDSDTETASDTITGKLTDIGGPLELEGTIVLTPPGNYDLKSRVRARPDAPESLRRNLNFLGAPEPDGRHIFQLAGSI